MDTPRLLSEYFAARAQLAGCISAPAEVDAAGARSKKLLSCAKHNHEEPRMCESPRRGANAYDSGALASPASVGTRAFGKWRVRNSSTFGNSSRFRSPK